MTYRPGIDGLRAIAVLAVIFYHLKLFIGFGGGYVGVDIFFVISGYLIGGIIIDDTANGSFSYVQFYARRLKRLFAAFLVVGLAAAAVGYWLLLPVDYWHEGKSLVACTVFLSNVLFYRDAGYFDPASITKPLLHTWSLGVEEQFYLFFPVLMRLAVRCGRLGVPVMLAAIGVLSLAYSQYLLAVHPAASFYLLPSRAWELLLGAAVAQPHVRDLSIPPRYARILTYLSVAGLLLPIALYSDATWFPAFGALPCCLATAWLLWSGRHATRSRVQAALSSRVPVAIGRISYSLYLWHWPIYVFIVYYEAGEIGWVGRSIAISLTFALAALSWRFVEQPIRYMRRPPSVVFTGALLGSLVLAGVGYAIWRSGGAPDRLAPQTRGIAYAAGDFFQTADRCWSEDNAVLPGINYCRIGAANAAEQFLIWGDSHARAILEGVDQAAKEQGVAGTLIFAGGCMPAFDLRKVESATGPRSDNACAAQNIAVKALLSRRSTIKKILLVGRWAYYSEGQGVGIDAQNLIRITRATDPAADSATATTQQAAIVAQALADTVRWLRAHDYEVYLLEDMPEIPDFSSRRLFQTVRAGHADAEEAIARFGKVARADVERRQRRSNEALAKAAADNAATIVRTHQLVCNAESCSAWSAYGPAYFDNNHITGSTSRRIREIFLPAITVERAPRPAPAIN
jgi:peptidoglycan/LPS O-acetylase OafA/YrhL